MRHAIQRWLFRSEAGAISRVAAVGVARLSRRRAASRTAPLPPVATWIIGGLTVGGAGKTPVVELLARRALDHGLRPAVVCRGYRARIPAVARVPAPDGRRFGDEPSALRRSLPAEVAVWVGADRPATIRAAGRSADLVLVDDGFQDPTLPRTAEIVVVDATAPRRVMPAGPLREPLSALARADLVWLHKVDEAGAKTLPAAVRSVVRPIGLRAPDGRVARLDHLAGADVVAACGIARPASFLAQLDGLRARIVAICARADHHRFTRRERAPLVGLGLLVTTSKDAERFPSSIRPWVLEVGAEIVAGAEAVEAMLAEVGRT